MNGNSVEQVLTETRTRMRKSVDDLSRELATVRTGRASLHLFDPIRVDYYGTLTPINQLATLHVAEATMVTIQPWDPTQIENISRAILASNLGLNPSSDGRLIRVPIPPLTEERRKQLARHVRKVTEQHRTAVRNIRRSSNDRLKKLSRSKVISEDDEHRGYDKVQKITDDFIAQADDLGRLKESEVLEV